MTRAALLSLALALTLGCGRDLTVPGKQAPALDPQAPLQPAQAYVGQLVRISGSALGTPASTQVLIDGQAAVIAPSSPAGELDVEVPELADGSPRLVGVVVTTAGGSAQAQLSYLGLGHPRSPSLSTVVNESPAVLVAQALGSRFLLLDVRHRALLAIDAATGQQGSPAWLSNPPVDVFASGDKPWVLEAASPPELRHLDLTQPVPTELVQDRLTLAGVDPAALSPAIADCGPAGLHVTLPGGAPGTIVDADLGRLQVSTWTVPGLAAVRGCRAQGDTALVCWTAAQFFRLDLPAPGGQPRIALGAAIVDARALPAGAGPAFALEPATRRLAYVRADLSVGFVSWDAGSGAPVLSSQVVVPLLPAPTVIAWSPAGDHLLIGDRTQGRVVSFDLAASPPAAAGEVSGISASLLVPIRAGPAAGDLLAAAGTTSVLLSPRAEALRSDPFFSSISALAVDGRRDHGGLVATTAFGPLLVDEDTLQGNDRPPTLGTAPDTQIFLKGLRGGLFGVVGFLRGALLALRPTAAGATFRNQWDVIATTPEATQDVDVLPAPGGLLLAAITGTDPLAGPLTLRLLPVSTPAPATTAYPLGAGPVAERALPDGTLAVVHGGPGSFALAIDRPGLAASADQPLPLLGKTYALADVRGPWSAPSLGGVLVAGPLQSAPGTPLLGTGGLFLLTSAGWQVAFVRNCPDPAALSPDGTTLFCRSKGVSGGVQVQRAGLDENLVFRGEGGALVARPSVHLDLPALPGATAFSLTGDRLYVALPGIDSIAVIE